MTTVDPPPQPAASVVRYAAANTANRAARRVGERVLVGESAVTDVAFTAVRSSLCDDEPDGRAQVCRAHDVVGVGVDAGRTGEAAAAHHGDRVAIAVENLFDRVANVIGRQHAIAVGIAGDDVLD